MPFGEIFVGTFRQIWQHKKLWLFGLLATLLGSLGVGFYQLFGLRWQGNYMNMVARMMEHPDLWPRRMGAELMSGLGALALALAVLILFGLIGYVISLVMRGAIMHEAALAWAGEQTDTSRGVSVGVGRAVYVFLLDLLWGIVPFIFGCSVALSIPAFIAALVAARADEGWIVFLVMLFVALLCAMILVGLLLFVFTAIFPPLMYQSAVVGGRGLGAAIREGWRLAIHNLGALILFWLLLALLSAVLNGIIQMVMLPLTLPWMGVWMREWSGAMEQFMEGGRFLLPRLHTGWLVISGLASVLLSLAVNSFLLTFRYTLYAEVYRRLTGATPAVAAVEPPAAPPATVEPPASSDILVPDEPPAEDEEPPRVG